jgi:two-component system chemotaxis response regulator CheY
MRCVIADDVDIPRKICRRILRNLGHETVGEAANGAEAVDLCARLRPDLVLLDISMPVLNGADAAQAILAAGTARYVVMVSSNSQEAIAGPLIARGARFVTKPYEPKLLAQLIQTLV